MTEALVALFLLLLVFVLPIKWGFSLSLAVSYTLFYFRISDVATAMFVVLFLKIIFKKNIKNSLKNKLFLNHCVLVIFGAISLLWVENFLVGFSILIAQIKVLIIAIISLQVMETKNDFKYLVFGTFAGMLYILIVLNGWKFGLFGVSISNYSSNIQKFGRLLIQELLPDRHTPINSNTWAALVSISAGIFMVYYYYIGGKSLFKKYILGFFLVLVLFSTTNLGSRGALIGVISSFFLLFFFQKPKAFYRNLIIILILFYSGLMSVDLIASIIPQENEIIQSRLAESKGEDPRVNIWLSGLNMAFDNFFTGVGIGNSGIEFKNYKVDANFASDKLALHNSFLTHFAELGIIGIFLLLRGMYLWQKPKLTNKSTQLLFIVVSFNILINAFAHSFELENYFISIIYSVHAYFMLEQREFREHREMKSFQNY